MAPTREEINARIAELEAERDRIYQEETADHADRSEPGPVPAIDERAPAEASASTDSGKTYDLLNNLGDRELVATVERDEDGVVTSSRRGYLVVDSGGAVRFQEIEEREGDAQ